MSQNGWIGVDLDGTLAEYNGWLGPTHIGKPVVPMLARVKAWRAEGREVRIFTARIYPLMFIAPDKSAYYWQLPDGGLAASQRSREQGTLAGHAIQAWCAEHVGEVLPITCVKDFGMIELWDDRAVQVIPNTGEPK